MKYFYRHLLVLLPKKTMGISMVLILAVTFTLVCYAIKKIIYISHIKHLFDEPSEVRKIHSKRTPNLGGVAIFTTLLFTCCIGFSFFPITNINSILFSSLMLFLLGLTDDLVGVDPAKKFIAQIAVALIVSVVADFRFSSFYEIFGLHEIPAVVSIILTTVFIIFLINAFNLIDGINCLAGSIGLLACMVFSFYFWQMKDEGWLLVSFALCRCLSGFLLFNKTPAKIFMGDTGSMFLGYAVALLSIHFAEASNATNFTSLHPQFPAAPALVMALVFIPCFDTLRIFSLRIIRKQSPFQADRSHIHHRLIDLGFSHMKSTGILLLVNSIALLPVLLLVHLRIEILMAIILLTGLVANTVLSFYHNTKLKQNKRQFHSGPYTIPTRKIFVQRKTVLK